MSNPSLLLAEIPMYFDFEEQAAAVTTPIEPFAGVVDI
jgi:hypothetical protein